MHKRTDRQLLRVIPSTDYAEGRRGEAALGAVRSEADHPRQRTTLPAVLQRFMNEFFIYYVRGRVFEWTMGLAMLFAGIELLVWDNVLTFGAFRWLLVFLDQKWIGTIMLFVGWLRVSSLMFNGQLLFGRRFGYAIRSLTAVIAASLWAQFAVALLQLSIDQGFPSVGFPFWTTFTLAELLVAYSVGMEWKKL